MPFANKPFRFSALSPSHSISERESLIFLDNTCRAQLRVKSDARNHDNNAVHMLPIHVDDDGALRADDIVMLL